MVNPIMKVLIILMLIQIMKITMRAENAEPVNDPTKPDQSVTVAPLVNNSNP